MNKPDYDFAKELFSLLNKPKDKAEECMQNIKKLNELLRNKK